MKPNRIRGYDLENTGEVHAAQRAAQAAGDEVLAEAIHQGVVYVATEKGQLTKNVQLDRQQSKALIRDLEFVAEGNAQIHESYLTDVEDMLKQHEQMRSPIKKVLRSLIAPEIPEELMRDPEFRAIAQG